MRKGRELDDEGQEVGRADNDDVRRSSALDEVDSKGWREVGRYWAVDRGTDRGTERGKGQDSTRARS